MSYTEFLIKIVYCFILSLLIGLERLSGRHVTGLRTNVLVSLAAFMFVSFSFNVNTTDQTRMAAQVVSGIGFLGAGVIMKDGLNVKGLTTAATLWSTAAIGVLCAGSMIVEASIGCFFILFSNIFLKNLTTKLSKYTKEDYIFNIKCSQESEKKVRSLILKQTKNINIDLKNIETKTLDNGEAKLYAYITSELNFNYLIDRLMAAIMKETGVISVGFKKVELKDDDSESISE